MKTRKSLFPGAPFLGGALFAALIGFMPGCDKTDAVEDVRPVRAIVVERKTNEEPLILTGQIGAHQYVNASFRLSGRVVERMVEVGSVVKAGQPLARLDAAIEKDALTAAQAEVAAAKAFLDQAGLAEKRAGVLVKTKAVSKNDYDEALRQLKSAEAQMQGAEAKLHSAREQLDFTLLTAETDGVVTDKGAEVGEVVAAGHMIVRIAENKQIDALFDVPEVLVRKGLAQGQRMDVFLDADRSVHAEGAVYEIAPQPDSSTRTYLVKTALDSAPPLMLLGATVVGSFQLPENPSIQIPASSLTTADNQPAVWLVELSTKTVRLASVKIERYTTDAVVISEGLKEGDTVVTAGVQALHQGQKVKVQDRRHDQD